MPLMNKLGLLFISNFGKASDVAWVRLTRPVFRRYGMFRAILDDGRWYFDGIAIVMVVVVLDEVNIGLSSFVSTLTAAFLFW